MGVGRPGCCRLRFAAIRTCRRRRAAPGDLARGVRVLCCEIVSGVEFTIDWLGGACPAQAVGRLADDRPFYFRARHGEWTLEVGPPGADADDDWPVSVRPGTQDLVWAVAVGEDPTMGYMPEDTVRELLEEHLGKL